MLDCMTSEGFSNLSDSVVLFLELHSTFPATGREWWSSSSPVGLIPTQQLSKHLMLYSRARCVPPETKEGMDHEA